jgi:hypothetical protein
MNEGKIVSSKYSGRHVIFKKIKKKERRNAETGPLG